MIQFRLQQIAKRKLSSMKHVTPVQKAYAFFYESQSWRHVEYI